MVKRLGEGSRLRERLVTYSKRISLPRYDAQQWRSQNRIVARAQVGHIYNAAHNAKVSVRKHALLGGSRGMLPQENFGI